MYPWPVNYQAEENPIVYELVYFILFFLVIGYHSNNPITVEYPIYRDARHYTRLACCTGCFSSMQ